MSKHLLDILYEDNHLLVLNKPAGIATAHSDGQSVTMDELAREYLRERYQKPGNIFLGVVHRLDKPVSGVLVFARTSKAASRLSEQFRERDAAKLYWALTEAAPTTNQGVLEDWLFHDDAQHRVRVVAAEHPQAKNAKLTYLILQRTPRAYFWQLQPETGRKHQLRVQLASRGYPILGDAKYGATRGFPAGIALHARQLSFTHPTKAEDLTFTAQLPRFWRLVLPTLVE